MTVKIDFKNKIVYINETVNFKELSRYINKIFGDSNDVTIENETTTIQSTPYIAEPTKFPILPSDLKFPLINETVPYYGQKFYYTTNNSK